MESSIKSIRDSVDFISVVYQTKSWYGNPCNPTLEDVLSDLVQKNLIDATFEYHMKPINQDPRFFELEKRNLGLQISEQFNCTHHLTIDTDEYFKKDEFENMKQEYIDEDLEGGICQVACYYKDPSWQITPISPINYHSLLFKTNLNSFKMNYPKPYNDLKTLVDPTRRMPVERFKVFQSNEILMHHMSFIRKDLSTKFKNSSAGLNHIPDVYYEQFKNYEVGQVIPLFKPLLKGEQREKTIKVENIFNVPKF